MSVPQDHEKTGDKAPVRKSFNMGKKNEEASLARDD